MRGLSLVAPSGGHSSSRCTGLSLSWPLLLQSTGSRRAGSVIVAHGPSCSAACRIFPDQGSNPCPLHWQAILNHCATREALNSYFYIFGISPFPPHIYSTIQKILFHFFCRQLFNFCFWFDIFFLSNIMGVITYELSILF